MHPECQCKGAESYVQENENKETSQFLPELLYGLVRHGFSPGYTYIAVLKLKTMKLRYVLQNRDRPELAVVCGPVGNGAGTVRCHFCPDAWRQCAVGKCEMGEMLYSCPAVYSQKRESPYFQKEHYTGNVFTIDRTPITAEWE